MAEMTRSGRAFAIKDEAQYQSVTTVADQQVIVRDRDGQAGLLSCHASQRLGQPGSGIERLVVVVHGALRDSEQYFAYARAAAGDVASATLIVAPQFLADVDLDALNGAASRPLYWSVEGWKGGEAALGPAPISSFTAMDCLLEQLAGWGRSRDSGKLSVVIMGNSAGGQYVNRYAAVGRFPDLLAERGISVRFIIANPSTYLYFDHERPVTVPNGTGINRWRYGFEAAPAYVDTTPRQSLERYLARDVTIVLGSEDRDSAALLLEVSAAAMAQGANRLERGINYDRHVHRLSSAAGLATRHRIIQLDGIGHAARDVLAAPQTREIMFGELVLRASRDEDRWLSC
jgi:hypothetical protein